MAHDPFNTPADRLRGVLKYWMWYLAIAAVLIVLTERNLIARENKDHLVSGEVERIDRVGDKSRATVRLGEAQETVVVLPSGTPCHPGSKIRLVRHDNVSEHAFRPADPPCAG
ncbi:MAG TPA: TOBE domain-containing protein [Sphingopyxis sp.]|nr:TOBE domain-containing protein [Sphingopyxis sp.]